MDDELKSLNELNMGLNEENKQVLQSPQNPIGQIVDFNVPQDLNFDEDEGFGLFKTEDPKPEPKQRVSLTFMRLI